MTFSRIVHWGLINFSRNRWLALVAIFTVTITLLVISFFLFFSLFTSALTLAVKEKLDLSIYFKGDVKLEDIQRLQTDLANRTDVKEVKYITPEEAYQTFQEKPLLGGQLGEQIKKYIKEYITPQEAALRSLKVKPQKADNLKDINQYLQTSSYKEMISNTSFESGDEKIVERLLKITRYTKLIGWSVSLFFIILSMLVIVNAARLTTVIRKDEIEIMRLVGASNIFIQGPFIIEGALYGLIAAIICVIVWGIALKLLSSSIANIFYGTSFDALQFIQVNFIKIALIQMGIGLVVGVLATLYGVRRYIKI
mgnify:CR=1 FL=1